MPDDAVFVQSSVSPAGNPLDVYVSASLAGANDVSDGVGPSLGDEPGTFIAIYYPDENGIVSSILIAAGNNP